MHEAKLEFRECTGVSGGDMPAMAMSWGDGSLACDRVGLARYTELHAPSPSVLFRPFVSVRKT